MSTEKSLLTLEEVELPRLRYSQMHEGLLMPIGVTPGGKLETLMLQHNLGTDHVCLFGCVGSGKSKAVEFMLKSVIDVYGWNVSLCYIDGKNCDVKFWKKYSASPTNYFKGCETVDDLTESIDDMLKRRVTKDTCTPCIIVFDDIEHLMCGMDESYNYKLRELLTTSTSKNVHVLYISQAARVEGGFLPGVSYEQYFGTLCATRVDDGESVRLFGCNLASLNGGMRKYGELVYKYRNSVSKVRVPSC